MLEKILNQKALLNTILVAIVIGGIFAYQKIGKLEDAEIPVKSAVVTTIYPGATAHEVELEVTDVLEKEVQKLENIDNIESRSLPGFSQITVNIESSVLTKDLPQLWDHLRRKVEAVESSLPPGAQAPIVNDDFGDVYGIFVAVTGEGYTYKELHDYVNYIRRKALEVDGIKRVELFGTQTEAIELTISKETLAGLKINPMMIIQAMNDQGEVVDAGSIISGDERIRLSVGQKFSSIEEIEKVLIQVPEGGNFKLGDIAKVSRSFFTPKSQGLMYNGENAISLAISMESGVNVIKVGEAFDLKLSEIEKELPLGIEIHNVFSQPERVSYAIDGFITNLVQSVLIVIVVILLAMGMRSGLLIASGLLFTILGTFIIMLIMDIELQRISLAAIIIAMGMLVDNSIVVAEGIMTDLKLGIDRKKAFTLAAKQTAMPLLGATLIAILAFMPLAMSPDATGEFLSSLFTVLAISLFLSWIFAMVQTPFMAAYFFRKKGPRVKKGASEDPYDTAFYRAFRRFINFTLSHKILFVTLSFVILGTALYNFQHVKFKFMPNLDYNQFIVEYILPQGAEITSLEKDIRAISKEIVNWPEVDQVTAAVGSTPARYSLLRPVANPSFSYGELIIDSKDYETTIIAGEKIINYIQENYPQADTRKRVYGPAFNQYEIEVQFSGPDPAILKELAEQAKTIMRNEPTAVSITDNWKNKVKVLNPQYSVEQARKAGVTRKALATSIATATEGMTVGLMQEGNNSLPIRFSLEETIGNNVEQLGSLPVWGSQNASSIPLAQLVDNIDLKWETIEVFRYNSERSIRAQCDPAQGFLTTDVEKKLMPAINSIDLPDGYTLDWKGSSERSSESQNNLFKFLPLALGLMLIIIIALFNNVKHAIIIMVIFPLAFIGIVAGFLLTNGTLTFIGIIGALGLIGMMIKNTIVLLDEINLFISNGMTELKSIVMAAMSRLRPVVMASATTILGMFPLLFDVMFQSLAITIIFGLLVGTIITLIVVPVIYATLFKVDISPLKNRRKNNSSEIN